MTRQRKWNKGTLWFLGLSLCGGLFIVINGFLSHAASHSISVWVMKVLFPNVPFTHPSFAHYEMLVRKIAHLLEYGALGMWLWFFKLSLGASNRKISGWWLVMAVFLVGALDEFLQSCSQRTGTVYDVLIDLLGGVLGMAAAMGIHKLWKLYQNRRNHHG